MSHKKQPLRLIFFTFLLVCLLTGMAGITRVSEQVKDVQAAPPLQVAIPSNVVISEFRTRGANGADDEFIEIFNPTGSAINLNNWLLRKSSGCGTTLADIATINTSLAPGQHYLVANGTGYTGTADQTYTTTLSDDGGIALINNASTIIDQVGMCNGTTYKEGTNLTQLSATANQSYERKFAGEVRNCNDTNNNVADFVLNASSSNPQSSSSPAVPCLFVTGVDSTTPDGTYTSPTAIDITLTFSAPVTVAGAPRLQLETGITDRPATYLSGSGSNVLTFRYNAVAGDYSTDLDYISSTALSLNGGGIYDVIGNAILTLPTPGSAGSLGANRNIQINIDNGIPPAIVSFKRQNPVSANTNADSLTFRVTFNETVIGVDTGDFVVHPNGASPTTTATVTNVTAISSNIYDVTISGGDLAGFPAAGPSGIVGLDLSTAPITITDQTGNALPAGEPTPAANDETYLVDNTNPTVTITRATSPVQPPVDNSAPVNFIVTFSEKIDPTTFVVSDITQGTPPPPPPNLANNITWSITNSGDNQTFTLSATAIAQNGWLVPSINGNQVSDPAGNGNVASTTAEPVNFNDNVSPTVTVNRASGQVDPATTLPVRFTVVFSEQINTSTFTPSDITQGGTASGITWTITDSGNHRTFTLSATVVTGPGTLVPSISAGRVTDIVGNVNVASTGTTNSVRYGPPPTRTPTLSRTPTKPRTPTRTRTPTRVPTVAPPPLVAINEFVPRPGHDWNGDGKINPGDEYIELINHGVINVNLNNYSLDDEVNIGSAPYKLPSITIRPGQRIVFYGSETGLLLSDGGDGVRLLKPNGQLMDAFNYTTVGYPDQAYCRLPDDGGADDWNNSCYPTPGLRNARGNFGTVISTPVPDTLCPFSDIAPSDFVFAECDPYGNNIWRPAYWDDPGYLNGQSLLEIYSKWDVFAE